MSDHKKRPVVTTSEDNFSRCHCTTCELEAENERLRAALQRIQCEIHRDGGQVRPANAWRPEYHFNPEDCTMYHCAEATRALAVERGQSKPDEASSESERRA